ncbi:glyoxylase-like metal-dependent hydrolase (beta-lactamase superfamily II) [Geothermobacter ehrlichii]|uniref:Glyoxylase-like metal-dependent hydrolase (Beta-lactamase superfamily II) n=1 Tax=Geothermobacter ehrlichii TaxID=213224 RepID=A0A5D3WJV5_9BACT|nr:MBL fold metallo-hydrolase [Geothermobacter ehrlichii]TYO98881.1 glyoxylase-like metal-dependent hydrolase (beta-lactamase superfamily II) [Geothermobacter ehrlichii]
MHLDNLFCIDLDQPALRGFRKFISAWCLQTNGKTLVVDPGPLSTIPHLVTELRRRGIERVDYILLTHIHIDHAGGTGALLREFPGAQVICHPDGVRHMVAPQKLWEGSLKVLGRTAEAYGEIQPVPAENIGFTGKVGTTGIEVHLTPGHAPHHCCYLAGDLLFAGEVAGVRSEVAEGIYMRPATPPRFILKVALDSVQRMIDLQPRRMVFAHYGLVDDALTHLRIGHRQLQLWVRGAAAVAAGGQNDTAAFIDWLLERDEIFRNIDQLDEDLLQREREFIGNSFRGMRDYVAGLSETERQALLAAT